MSAPFGSWGRYPAVMQAGRYLRSRHELLPTGAVPVLPYGNGRSYGDVCLSPGGTVLSTRYWDRFLAFDENTGVLRCEAGVRLADILEYFVPRGWFLPVTPGTKYVTVGGAMANDVHGKNHHTAGTFGRCVEAFELLRSDGSRRVCTSENEPDWFSATIGGLGLTGVITWADIRLKRIVGTGMDEEILRFADLSEFFAVSRDSDAFEYTVAWVDCTAKGRALGRGLFMRANHAEAGARPSARRHRLAVPVTPPFSLVNGWSLKAFNALYYHRQRRKAVRRTVHYDPYFYPLDSIRDWNRMYGPRGFLQYQCVVPENVAEDAIADLLKRISDSGTGSFLAVLKLFGDVPSPGWLSFPMPGATLALDFANQGARTEALFQTLDDIVLAAGGRLYPAKDAHMSASQFQRYYPEWTSVEALRDPAIDSGFWQRVTGREANVHE